MGIEYVPHPDPDRHQMIAMPDIVFQEGNHPRVTVFDAKYVGRSWVARNASRLHEKYSRMRLNGTPVVGNVLAIHPHRDLEAQWAGYGYIAMAPGLNGSRAPRRHQPFPSARLWTSRTTARCRIPSWCPSARNRRRIGRECRSVRPSLKQSRLQWWSTSSGCTDN